MNGMDSQVVKQLLLFVHMLDFMAMIIGAVAIVCLLVYLCSLIMLCLGDARVRRSRVDTILPAACPETTSALPAKTLVRRRER
jgi:hypothetical protein